MSLPPEYLLILWLLIDKSGSMRETKLNLVKKTLLFVIDQCKVSRSVLFSPTQEPRLSNEVLEQHIQQLSTILMQPWMSSKRFEVIRKDVEKLVDSLHAYQKYLLRQCDRVKSHQQSPQPVFNETNASLVTISANNTTMI